jgi:hypothetical protein
VTLQRTKARVRLVGVVVAGAVVLGVVPARADQPPLPAAGTVVDSPLGLLGCVATNHEVVSWYCFAVQQVTDGANAGSFSVRAERYDLSVGSLDRRLVADDDVVVPPSALTVDADGSFDFSAALPTVGSVLLAGRDPVGQSPVGFGDKAEMDWALTSPGSAITPYAYLVTATVNGTYAPSTYVDVWRGSTSGSWEMSPVF